MSSGKPYWVQPKLPSSWPYMSSSIWCWQAAAQQSVLASWCSVTTMVHGVTTIVQHFTISPGHNKAPFAQLTMAHIQNSMFLASWASLMKEGLVGGTVGVGV